AGRRRLGPVARLALRPRGPAASQPPQARPRVVAPPRQLLLVAQGLLPAELHERAEQAQLQLPLEPAGGRHAVALQGGAELLEDRLLAASPRQPAAVEGDVPGDVVAGGPLAEVDPVDEHRAAV